MPSEGSKGGKMLSTYDPACYLT